MSSKGYVYILINPSMPGLLKIGKTMRNPEDRAKELSAATGVATPFIVAYKIEVNNCDYCEQYIHEQLELQGCRVNSSREFFKADMTDVINALIKFKNDLDFKEDYVIECTDDDDGNPWDSEEAKGDEWNYGTNGHVIDRNQAIKHYRNAIVLGSEYAYSKIGKIYIDNEKMSDAFEILMEGIDNDCIDCYRVLSSYYFELCRISYDKILFDETCTLDENFEKYERIGYFDNAQRAFRSFVIGARERFGEVVLDDDSFAYFAAAYIDNLHLNESHGGEIDYDVLAILKPYKQKIDVELFKIIERRAEIASQAVANLNVSVNNIPADELYNLNYARFFE